MQDTVYGEIYYYKQSGEKDSYYAYYHGFPLGVVSGSGVIRSIEENPDSLIPAVFREFLDLYLAGKIELNTNIDAAQRLTDKALASARATAIKVTVPKKEISVITSKPKGINNESIIEEHVNNDDDAFFEAIRSHEANRAKFEELTKIAIAEKQKRELELKQKKELELKQLKELELKQKMELKLKQLKELEFK